jgi:hypothetical protein
MERGNGERRQVHPNTAMTSHRASRLRTLSIILASLLLLVVAAGTAVQYAIHHAGPILRARVVQSLATRFDGLVQLGEFHVSVYDGLNVEGKDLAIRSKLYPELPPQISISSFSFHARLADLFRSPMHVGSVNVDGLVVRIPPKSRRAAIRKSRKGHGKLKIAIDRIYCQNARLLIMTDDPKKRPMQFKIGSLVLRQVGPHQAMHFTASLINPKPIGDIQAEGNFGPWLSRRPGDTPIDGTYSFTHADLSTTKGIAGMLSSAGKFSGKLDRIGVDGSTDTPDFSINVSGHKVALHTDFHATVDGTNGNTYLQPVHAHFRHTDLIATGHVVRAIGVKGHDIHLVVRIDRGRVEDLLYLGVKTSPPVMSGALHLRTLFDLPAGKQSVSRKLRLSGSYAADNVAFTNLHIQRRVEELSLRSQGRAAEARQMSRQQLSQQVPLPAIPTSLHGDFLLADRKLTLPHLVCNVPGTEIALAGTYTLDGKTFDFVGTVRMDARVSSMVGGWKGALLKPMDSMFAKHGANTEIPIRITGTNSKPRFGLKL